MKHLLNYANTDQQRLVVEAYIAEGSERKAAAKLGITRSSINFTLLKLKKRASLAGDAPEHGLLHPVAPGFTTKRVSTAYGEDGGIKLQWHIQEPEKVALEEMQAGLIEAFRSEVGNLYEPVAPPDCVDDSLMSCYMIGDHHFGMYAWAAETGGDDYDVDVSEQLLRDSARNLIERSPPSETGVLVNVGDFLHANDTTSTTPASKNTLDTDGRMGRVARLAGLLLRNLVLEMLKKHKKVIVINARGNHDPDASMWLNEVVRAYFENEPRVEVKDNFSKWAWLEFGQNLIVVHHGDRINRNRMYEAITRNLSEQWGRCKHRFGWTGHIHHKDAQEVGGMLFESWGVLAPPDEWHAASGYGAERSMSCVVLHKSRGEDVRYKVKVS